MIIFLTFDDGIHAGTKEVLEVLRETGVRGTFFLTGLHIDYSFQSNPQGTLNSLSDIYENHVIGNHSYSHGHDEYWDFYTRGVLINNVERETVFDDFRKNTAVINSYINQILIEDSIFSKYPLAKNQKIPLARLPGNNTWRVKCGGSEPYYDKRISRYSSETKKCSIQLHDYGYQIFGWDVVWNMTFDFSLEAEYHKQNLRSIGKIDYADVLDVHPDFDMYLPANLMKDRTTNVFQEVESKIICSTDEKVVLLMHERAFRNNFEGNPMASVEKSNQKGPLELYNLIRSLQKKKFVFQTLDNYNTR